MRLQRAGTGVPALIDLHVHTTASDGTSTPEEVIRAALRAGLTAIAITDHDSVDGVQPGIDAAEPSALEVVPGVELSASHDGRDVHILGYFIDHRDADLLARLKVLREQRVDRARAMVEELSAAGHEIRFCDVMDKARGGSVGRSHVARALVDAGEVETIEEAFVRFIGRGGPFYVKKPLLPASEAIGIIRDAGGVSVLAHPGVSGADGVISVLAAQGLGGIEAYHRDHDEQSRERYVMIAEYLGLVVTGGSDYHGPRTKVGELGLPVRMTDALEKLRDRAFARP